MALGLYQSIAARYSKLNESLSKGLLKPEITALLSHQYAWPVNKDAGTLGMATLASAEPSFADDSDHSIPFIISTQDVDRDGDIVVSMGGILGPYSQNPVVLFGHGSWQVPIGTARNKDGQLYIRMEENRVRAKVFFDVEDPDADYIYGKVKRGMLNATSISFLPRQAYQRERGKAYHDDMSPLGWVFEAWELTEFSIVSIPSNAGALRDSYDSEKSFISPKLQKAMQPYLAQAKGCFNGYCPCPPCEETMTTLTSGLPGTKKHKKACGCGGKCNTCKALTPGANTGEAAANNPEERHEHEEQTANTVHEDAVAKLPKLIEAGYPRDVACCMAVHMAHEGKKGDAIDGHEQIAEMYKDMGGDSGTDGGYAEGGDQEMMSLKSYMKSVNKAADKDPENDAAGAEEGETKPDEETEATDGDKKPKDEETEAIESGPQFKESAVLLGHMHNHMKSAHEYLSKALPTLDHEHIAKAMTSHLPDIEGHMGDYESLVTKHHKGVKMDALCKHCKGLAEGDPEREVVDNQDGSEGRDDATGAQPKRDTGGDKTGADLMREENENSKLSPAAIEKGHIVLDKLDAFVFAKAGLHV